MLKISTNEVKELTINFTNMSKEEKKQLILNYIKDIYKEEKRLVSKREIRKIFHVELYNYFKNIFDMYQRIGVEVPLYFCPKKYARNKIIEFVKERSEKGLYPTKTEIEKELGIHIYSYFEDIKDVYKNAKIDFRLYEKRKYDRGYTLYSDTEINKIKKKICRYIRNNTKNSIYPSVIDIQRDLKIAFYKYFPSTKDAYVAAKIDYYRPCPILMGKEKEIALTKIVIALLKKMNFKIKRISIYDTEFFNKKEDIKICDSNNNIILVELKAYRKDYNISKRELLQLKSYMDCQKINKGFFITTSNKVNFSFSNIKVIDGNKLCSLLGEFDLIDYFDIIRWIQEEKVNSRMNLIKKDMKRKRIINYILNYKGIPSKNQIEKDLRIDMRTYFSKEKIFTELIKKIKNKKKRVNTDSIPVCKAPQS